MVRVTLSLLLGFLALFAWPASAKSERLLTALTKGWEFRFDNALTPEAAMQAGSNGWEQVTLPHTWNRLGEYRVGRTEATDNRQGKGWYRLTLDGARLAKGKRHFIEFEAVGNVADLWVNGRHAGTHKGAFSRFRFDITDLLELNGTNRLLLRADNSNPEPGSSTEHVIPLLGDFFIHGGVYRPARLVSASPSHIALNDYGGPGVYADASVNSAGQGLAKVRVRLTGVKAGQKLSITIRDATGKEAVRTARPVTAAEVRNRMATLSLSVPKPRLWNGRADPYLYSIEASLPSDAVTVPLGFRTLRFDPQLGFFLNGKHLPLQGVSRHQDYLGKGWALSREDHERDMALIAEMGANTVRFAHYQHATDWFELSDKYGMAVWAELPFVNKVGFGDAPASPELVANARTQMSELIRQNYNHPSVITWGTGNEVDIDLAFNRLGPKADARPLLRELHTLSKSEDPSRPTVIADCCEATPGDKAAYLPTLTGEADLMGYNRYYGWYYGKVSDLGPHLDKLHAKYPDIPLSVSEYGAGGALSQHVERPETHKIAFSGRPHPEEFQSWFHEQSWPQLRARRYLWGNWIWNMFDFSSRIRQEGDATDVNDKGLVSYDRKVRKDAFFYYKAHWSSKPVLHITSRRWTERNEPMTRIRVYSNAKTVALTLNGKPLGDIICADRICATGDIRLSPGLNVVTARAVIGSTSFDDKVEWMLTEQR